MRKLATAAAVSLALAAGSAHALGLGDIEMRSALNQPMDAEIPLNATRPGEVDGMIVQLASPDAFARAGIDRSALLGDLRFRVERDEDGQPYIRVSSRRPIQEPFLNFLVEVDWPDGRMVREYTVLLDPPVFMTPSAAARDESADQPAATRDGDDALLAPAAVERQTAADATGASDADRPAAGRDLADTQDILAADEQALAGESPADAADPAANARLDAAEISRRQQAANAAREGATTAETAPPRVGGPVPETVEVRRGDTLFEIANRTRLPTTSTQQMMLALLAANESAFIERNVNLVRAGAILRVPTREEQVALSQSDAITEILQQAQLWRDYRDNLRQLAQTRAVDATIDAGNRELPPEATPGATDSETAPAGSGSSELQIVADARERGAEASATTDPASDSEAARIARIGRELQLAREELASARLEGEDLGDARSELVSTNENLDALVTLQQNEVAALEAQLAQAREAREAVAEADADAESSESAVDDNIAAIDETLGQQRDATAGDSDSGIESAANEGASVELGAATGADPGTSNGDAAMDRASGDPNAGNAAPVAPSTTTPATPPRATTWYGDLLGDSGGLIMAGAGALGLLGLGALYFRRRRDTDFDEHGEVDYIDDDEANALRDQLGDDAYGDPADTMTVSSNDDPDAAASGGAADEDKILSEADVYIAYGLHGQAEELLAQAIERDPGNPAYAAKLLETHHAQNQIGEFADGAADFRVRFGAAGAAFWPAIAAFGTEIDPDNSLYREAPPTSMAASGAAATSHDSADDEAFESADAALTDGLPDAGHENESGSESEFGFESGSESVPEHQAAIPSNFESESEHQTERESELESESQSESERMSERVVAAASEPVIEHETTDPAFAFDESDFEATGDFPSLDSTAENEAPAQDEDGSIDFDGFGVDAPLLSTESAGEADDAVEKQEAAAQDDDTATILSDDFANIESLDFGDLDAGNDSSANESPATAVDGENDDIDVMIHLARAYIDMGDRDSASDTLDKIKQNGSPDQVDEAETLLRKIS